ncbi:MAG: hypothetical protein R3C09_21990 [Pirellulaceae bacterium]
MEEVPFEDRDVPRVEIDWERSAWWWYPVTRAIAPAVRMNALAVSLIALLLSMAGLRLGERLFSPAWQPNWTVDSLSAAPATYTPRIVHWGVALLQSLLSFERMGWRELGFLTFELLWLTMTFALLGGVLARRSLVELGQRTVSAWGEALNIVFSRWQSYLWSMGMHFVAVAGLLVPFYILGLLSRLGSFGAILSGVLLLLSYPLVFAIGRFVLSAIVCFPLSVCAIAAEKKADAFEGFSRSNAYFFQRPLLTALLAACLLLVGMVGELLVFWTITSGWWLMRGTYLIAGASVQPAAGSYVAAGNWLSENLLAAYWFSFLWSAAAAIYLILRKSVDSVELDELDSIESSVQVSLPEIPSTPPPPATQTAETE